MSYNGWSNWETWNTFNWLSNDKDDMLKLRQFSNRGAEEGTDLFRKWFYREYVDDTEGLTRDLLTSSVEEIDFEEIIISMQEESEQEESEPFDPEAYGNHQYDDVDM